MKKIFFPVIALLALLVSFASAMAACDCSKTFACVNQDGDTYCVPSDTECDFTWYKDVDGDCVVDDSIVDEDEDQDGWSNECDAFPDNPEEWMDIDGDSCGHNADLNDFDASDIEGCEETPECTEDEDCAEGEICVDGKCVPDTYPGCEADEDCLSDEICVDGECVPETYPSCETDDDCLSDEICVDGECVADTYPDCETDEDCLENEVCVDGTCQEEEEEESPVYSGGGGGGIVYCTTTWICTDWSHCEDGVQERDCVKTEKPDKCDVESTDPKPDEIKLCRDKLNLPEEKEDTAPVEQPSDEPEEEEPSYVVDMDIPDEEEGMPGITGRVIDFMGRPSNMFFSLVLIAALALLFLISKRKKKEES